MADVILVLNAGSSSINFSLFRVEPDALELRFRGQIEGLSTAPRFAEGRGGRSHQRADLG